MTDSNQPVSVSKEADVTADTARVERAAEETARTGGGLLRGSLGRNLGLIVALALICVAGVITEGDQFANVDNMLTVLRLASVIGVVSIGMTFVITGGGIDLSVGAIVALASVWATTVATQTMAEDTHWILMVGTALAVGDRVRAGQRTPDRLWPGGPVHRHPGDARRGPRARRDHREQTHPDRHGARLHRLLPR